MSIPSHGLWSHSKAFVSKLSDAESEAAETQVWLKFAVACGYMPPEAAHDLYTIYEEVLKVLFAMSNHAEQWVVNLDRRTIGEEPEEYTVF